MLGTARRFNCAHCARPVAICRRCGRGARSAQPPAKAASQARTATTARTATAAADRHRDEDIDWRARGHAIYQAARAKQPERWTGPTRNWDRKSRSSRTPGNPFARTSAATRSRHDEGDNCLDIYRRDLPPNAGTSPNSERAPGPQKRKSRSVQRCAGKRLTTVHTSENSGLAIRSDR